MKRKTIFLLVAFIAIAATIATVSAFTSKPTPKKAISYYWFDVTRTWMGRETTVEFEIFNTGFDESTSSPKTLQELGWSPANCSVDNLGRPTPLTSTPDKSLYSHP